VEAAVATASPTPSERPTFEQAFAADAAAESHPATPSTDTPTTDQSAATTEQPVTATAEAPITPEVKPGEPPTERWPDILKNARDKAAAEKQAEFDRDFGWAKTVPREALHEWTGIANRMANDPIAFLNELQAEIANHPVFGPQLRSHAARTLASGRAPSEVDVPDVEITDAQGNVIGKLNDIVERRAQQLIAKELGPLKQDFQTRQQQEKARQAETQAAETQRQVDTKASSIFDRVSKRPLYKEHEADIATAFEAMPADLDPGEAFLEAYLQVVGPKLEAHAQAKHLESLNKKAAASVSVNPAAPVASSTKRPTSFHDPALKWG
jgi:hypothetical protein